MSENAHPPILNLPATHLRAVKWLLENIPPDKFLWVLSGSGSLRLQGVDTQVHDLDIMSNQQTLQQIEQRLGNNMRVFVHLWESPGMRSLDGKAEIEGIQVEFLANVSYLQPDGSWESLTDFSRVLWVELQGSRVPVFPLEDELAAYIAMRRTEKVAMIRKTIAARSIR
jgi:hypothetical protein